MRLVGGDKVSYMLAMRSSLRCGSGVRFFLGGASVLCAVLSVGVAGPVSAEGRCPPGSYPVGGQGVGGCAPIGAGSGGPASLPRATGKWHKTWGAISASATGMVGVSVGKLSREEALAEADAGCRSKGATDCTNGFAYKNQCAALADPPSGSGLLTGGLLAPRRK